MSSSGFYLGLVAGAAIFLFRWYQRERGQDATQQDANDQSDFNINNSSSNRNLIVSTAPSLMQESKVLENTSRENERKLQIALRSIENMKANSKKHVPMKHESPELIEHPLPDFRGPRVFAECRKMAWMLNVFLDRNNPEQYITEDQH